MKLRKLIILCGPTAAGKTETAVRLAEHLHCPIISADSRQFYSELNIGVARPDQNQLHRAQHFLMADRSIQKPLFAADFAKEVHSLSHQLSQEFEYIIICGGSGLYLHAFLNGLDSFPDTPPEIRNEFNEKLHSQGLEKLVEELKEKDPETFAITDIQNPRRVIRALEIMHITGKKRSEQIQQNKPELLYNTQSFLVNPDKESLHRNIDLRTEFMFANGLIEECKQLIPYKNLPVLQTIGYAECFDYLEHKITQEECIYWVKTHTRQYAKRQLTWFRNKMQTTSIQPNDINSILNSLT